MAYVTACMSVCPRSKRKTTRAINMKLDTRTLYGGTSACIVPELKRSEFRVTGLPASVCMPIRLRGFLVSERRSIVFRSRVVSDAVDRRDAVSVLRRLDGIIQRASRVNYRYTLVSDKASGV